MRPKPVGQWFAVSCATCGVLVGWSRAPQARPFFCIPDFDDVAHVPDPPAISACCDGEKCFCGEPARHRVEETVFFDDPMPQRHPLTSYVCGQHFRQIMGLNNT